MCFYFISIDLRDNVHEGVDPHKHSKVEHNNAYSLVDYCTYARET